MGLAAQGPDGSVVFDAPPTDATGGTAAQDAIPVPAEAVPPPSLTDAAVEAVETAAAVGSLTDSAAPAAMAGGDLDALALRLYPRISRQLRLELLRERDRIGSLTDLRY